VLSDYSGDMRFGALHPGHLHPLAGTWIKNVCDVQPTPTSFTDADVDELIHWRNWRAPRFTHMRPSGDTPYDEGTAWVREDEQRTATLLDGLSNRFAEFIGIELDRLSGDAHVQLAKAGRLSGNAHSEQSAPDIGKLSEADNRHFARMAIDEAWKSVAEDDGRAHPRVGPVVVKDGKVLAVAHRGEMASGNHAEFVALEKKLAEVPLAGATVYTTLEP
jgi:Cytidine and deoxycytidylate deaminase zinc-binding region